MASLPKLFRQLFKEVPENPTKPLQASPASNVVSFYDSTKKKKRLSKDGLHGSVTKVETLGKKKSENSEVEYLTINL